MKRAVVVLAGGRSQIPFVRAVKRTGRSIILVDRDPHAACRALADRFVECSILDAGRILDQLQGLEEFSIEAVWTQSSLGATHAQAQINAQLGLEGFSPELAAVALDKESFRRRLARCGLSTAPEASSDGFPRVVRPAVTLVGKHEIFLVSDEDEQARAVERAAKASFDGRAAICSFVPGDDLILVGVRAGSRSQRIAVVREYNAFDDSRLIHLGHELLDETSHYPVDRMMAEVERLFAAHGGGAGPFMAGFRSDAEHFAWVEIHLDMGGDFIYEHLLAPDDGGDGYDTVLRELLSPTGALRPPAAPVSLLYALHPGDPIERIADELRGSICIDGSSAARVGVVRVCADRRSELVGRVSTIDRDLGRRGCRIVSEAMSESARVATG